MTREIKFRGLRTDGQGWVYGDLVRKTFDRLSGRTLDVAIKIQHCYPTEVDPATVSQYIGVKGYEGDYETRHENEVELFEDDIVEAMNQGYKGTFQIKFRTESAPTFILFPAFQNGDFWKIHASSVGRKEGDYFDNLKRIGNIYENPELLNISNNQLNPEPKLPHPLACPHCKEYWGININSQCHHCGKDVFKTHE